MRRNSARRASTSAKMLLARFLLLWCCLRRRGVTGGDDASAALDEVCTFELTPLSMRMMALPPKPPLLLRSCAAATAAAAAADGSRCPANVFSECESSSMWLGGNDDPVCACSCCWCLGLDRGDRGFDVDADAALVLVGDRGGELPDALGDVIFRSRVEREPLGNDKVVSRTTE